uniref:excitatory amino acid transporter 5 n=1 Tax=Myxine glutinosa TaxID=7769 RepID=UPI00358F3D76
MEWSQIRSRLLEGWRKNGLLVLSVLSVVLGCLLGFFLRGHKLTEQEINYLLFPGELLMRLLTMLILPLIISSLVSGLATLDRKASGRLGVITVAYYLLTTLVAVAVGIAMATAVHPGGAAQKAGRPAGVQPLPSSAHALLDLIRNMFPSNLVEATFQQYKTQIVPMRKLEQPGLEGTQMQGNVTGASDVKSVAKEQESTMFMPGITYKAEPGSSEGTNVLGIVIFSSTMGIMLGRMGQHGLPLVSFCQSLNEAIMKIVAITVWYFPFGIVFLIAGKILEMDDPKIMGKRLGLYSIAVVGGLIVHGMVILPLLFFVITKKNPIVFIRGILQALLIALATSSSSATLPITFKCLLENNGIDRQIARVVLPIGTTINMDGTALYEAVAALFIAQVNNYQLDLGQLLTISVTATAASIGAAGIPQAGLVTMVIVLTSVGLPTEDITLIVAVDWALDRCRTMINVLGDALAAGVVAHLCQQNSQKEGKNQIHNLSKDELDQLGTYILYVDVSQFIDLLHSSTTINGTNEHLVHQFGTGCVTSSVRVKTHECCTVLLCVALCELSDVVQSLLISRASIEENDNLFQCGGSRMKNTSLSGLLIWMYLYPLSFPYTQCRTTLEPVFSLDECRVQISIFFMGILSSDLNWNATLTDQEDFSSQELAGIHLMTPYLTEELDELCLVLIVC